MSVTGTHYIKVNAGVKNYVRNTYTSDTITSSNTFYNAGNVCASTGTAIINNVSTRSTGQIVQMPVSLHLAAHTLLKLIMLTTAIISQVHSNPFVTFFRMILGQLQAAY